MAYNEEVTMMMSVVPGAMTGISTLMGGLVSINNVFMDMTRQIDANFGLIDSSIITTGAVVAQLGLRAAEAFGEFEQGLKVAQMVSGQTAQEMEFLKQKANEFSVSYRTDIDQITEGLQTLGRAGLNSASEQTEVLQNGLSTAKLEGRDLNGVLEELIQNTALLGGNLNNSDFGESSKYVNDLLVATSMTAPITTHDVSETLKYSGGIAAAAGARIDSEEGKRILEDYMGAIAAFAQKGVTGSIAGTALRAFFNKPATQDSSVTEALSMIHLKPEYLWEDDEETMKPVSEQIGIIQNQMDELNVSTMDRLQIWSKIVGGKMGQQMMKLDSNSIKELTKDIRAANDAESLAAGTFQTFHSNMKEMAEQGQVAFRNFGENVARVLNPVIDIITKILELLSNPAVSAALFIGFITIIEMAYTRIKNVFNSLKAEFGKFREYFAKGEDLYSIRPSTVRKSLRQGGSYKEYKKRYETNDTGKAFYRNLVTAHENFLDKKYTPQTQGIMYALKSNKPGLYRSGSAHLLRTQGYMSQHDYELINSNRGIQAANLKEFGFNGVNDNSVLYYLAQNHLLKKDWVKFLVNPEDPMNISKLMEKSGSEIYEAYTNKVKEIIYGTEKKVIERINNEKVSILPKDEDEEYIQELLREKINLNTDEPLNGGLGFTTLNSREEAARKVINKSLAIYGDLELEFEKAKKEFDSKTGGRKPFMSFEAFAMDKLAPGYRDLKDAGLYGGSLQDWLAELQLSESMRGNNRARDFLDNWFGAKGKDRILKSDMRQFASLSDEEVSEFYHATNAGQKGGEKRLQRLGYTPKDLLLARDIARARLNFNDEELATYRESVAFDFQEARRKREKKWTEGSEKFSLHELYGPYSSSLDDVQTLSDYNTVSKMLPRDSATRDDIIMRRYLGLDLSALQMHRYVRMTHPELFKMTELFNDAEGDPLPITIPDSMLFTSGKNISFDDFKKLKVKGERIDKIFKQEGFTDADLAETYEEFLYLIEENREKIRKIIEKEQRDITDYSNYIRLPKNVASIDTLSNMGTQTLKSLGKMTGYTRAMAAGREKNLLEILGFYDDLRLNPEEALGNINVKYLKEAMQDSKNYMAIKHLAQMLGVTTKGADGHSLGVDSLGQSILDMIGKKERVIYGDKLPEGLPKLSRNSNVDIYSLDRIQYEILTGSYNRSPPGGMSSYASQSSSVMKYFHDTRPEVIALREEIKKAQEANEALKKFRELQKERIKLEKEIAELGFSNTSMHNFLSEKDQHTLLGKTETSGGFNQKDMDDWLASRNRIIRPVRRRDKEFFGDRGKVQELPPELYMPANIATSGYFNLSFEQQQELMNEKGSMYSRFKNWINKDRGIKSGLESAFWNWGAMKELDKDAGSGAKLKAGLTNVVNFMGGPYLVAMELLTAAINLGREAYEKYTNQVKELASAVQNAYSDISSAESSLKTAYKKNNPDATNEDVENYMLDIYSQRYEDFSSDAWLKKAEIKGDKQLQRYEYDEEKDTGEYKEAEEEEKTDEETYEEAVKENTGALYAATAQLQASMDSLVTKMQDDIWGVDGLSSNISDTLGKAQDNLFSWDGKGSSWLEEGNFLLTASQKDSNYPGYTEMAGLMLEDFSDSKGDLSKGLSTMFGNKDSQDILTSMNSEGKGLLTDLAKFAGGQTGSWGRLTRSENIKMQQSMKMDKKSWQAAAKEMAKVDMKRKAGKEVTQKDTHRLEGYIKKLATETGLSEIKIKQGLQLQQLQDMYAVAQQSMVPLAEQQAQIAAQHLVFGEATAGSTSGTDSGANATYATASVIASMVSVIAQAKAGEAYWEQQKMKGDPDALEASSADEYLKKGLSTKVSYDNFLSSIPGVGSIYGAGKAILPQEYIEKTEGLRNTTLFRKNAERPEIFTDWMVTYESMAEKSRNPNLTEAEAEELARKKLAPYMSGNHFIYNEDVISRMVRENYANAITPSLIEQYMGSDIGEVGDEGDGSGGSGSGDGDKDKNQGTRKERVDLVLCNKKEIPKLNVNLFKKPPTFTVLNKNFKLRDVKINTEDKPKAIMASIKNAFIDVQKRSDPKIIQDEEAEYDPVAATDGNSVPSGSSRTGTN